MDRRNRKLTSRELEVLHLVHLGLTNDEIAGRLGITSDGVKYHVSQILTKLGVSSRHEAVALAYGETRRPWWSAAVSSTLAKTVGVAVALGAIIFLVLLLWSPLVSEDSEAPPDITDLTVPNVIASVQQAVTSPGQVFHSQIEATMEVEGETTPYYTMELWVDAGREAVRTEYRLAPEQDAYDRATEATAIVSGRFMYIPDDPGEALRYEVEETSCPGIDSVWMATFLLCGVDWTSTAPSPLGEPAVQSGEFRGRDAIVLVYEVTDTVGEPNASSVPISPPPLQTGPMPADSAPVTPPPGETRTITPMWRVYVDADDYLPLAYTFTQQAGADSVSIVEAVYENEFVPLDDEIKALLDPRSIGYGAENAEDLLDEIEGRVPVYWLGHEFQAEGLGELVLARIHVGEQQGGVQQLYRVRGELIYEAPDGYPVVRLLLWQEDNWEAFLTTREGRILADPSCAQALDVHTGDAPSTVYVLPPIEFPGPVGQAPGESQCNYERRQVALVDRIIGVMKFDDVVVQVRQDGYAASVPEMQSLLRHLLSR